MLNALLERLFQARERVGRGAGRLDRDRPGWADAIEGGRLDLGHACNCPLGQLYGHYGLGLVALDLTGAFQSGRHGFGSSPLGALAPPLYRLENRLLRAAWVEAIRERAGRKRPDLPLLTLEPAPITIETLQRIMQE
jgi:hypothetical protein